MPSRPDADAFSQVKGQGVREGSVWEGIPLIVSFAPARITRRSGTLPVPDCFSQLCGALDREEEGQSGSGLTT
jgi:hypothetical protein